MAATTKLIRIRRPKFHSFPQPCRIPYRFFSSSSKPASNDATSKSESKSETQSQSPFSSYFSDVKASLQKESSNQNRAQIPRKTLSFSNSTPQTPSPKIDSLEEIGKNLSEFRRRSAAPQPSSSAASPSSRSGRPISFQELYKRNVLPKAEESGSASSDSIAKPAGAAAAGGKLSFEAIRESLRHLKLKPVGPNAQEPQMMIGGSDSLPASIFGKEKMGGDKAGPVMRTEFVKMYNYNELGEKLKMLRPENKKGNWFSLQELNERLLKLREIEEKESEARSGGINFKELRECVLRLRMSDDERTRKNIKYRLGILGELGGTPSFHAVTSKGPHS